VKSVFHRAKITNKNPSQSPKGVPKAPEAGLLKAAGQIYKTYCRLHTKLNKTPKGVAIDPKTYRGQLLFSPSPILLPGENFIPLEQLEPEAT
jgi:hypothetical protein